MEALGHRLKLLTVVETLLKIAEVPQGNQPAGKQAAVSSTAAFRGPAESPRGRFIYLRAHANARLHTRANEQTKKARRVLCENGPPL